MADDESGVTKCACVRAVMPSSKLSRTRFNSRFWRGPAFIRILGMATKADDRPEYDTLYRVRAQEEGAWVHPNLNCR